MCKWHWKLYSGEEIMELTWTGGRRNRNHEFGYVHQSASSASGQICAPPAWLALTEGFNQGWSMWLLCRADKCVLLFADLPSLKTCNQCQIERVLLPLFLTTTAEGRWNAKLGIPEHFSTDGVIGGCGEPQLCSVLLHSNGTAVC